MKLKVLLLLLSFYSVTFAQNQFQRVYTNPDSYQQSADNIIETPGGDFIIIGKLFQFFPTQESNIYVIKTNPLGDIIWSYRYEKPNNTTEFQRVRAIHVDGNSDGVGDDGFMIIATLINNLSISETVLIRISENGTLIWSKQIIGNPNNTDFYTIDQLDDGNFILGGTQNTGVSSSDNFYVLKLDQNGNFIWDFRAGFGGSNFNIVSRVKSTPDNGCIVVGNSMSSGFNQRGFIVKIDQNGGLEWNKVYDLPDIDFFNSVNLTSDGNYIVQGAARTNASNFPNSDDISLVKVDPLGNIIWSKLLYTNNPLNRAYFIEETADFGFILSGSAYTDRSLIKTNDQGSVLWAKNYGSTGPGGGPFQSFNGVRETNDQGFITIALTDSVVTELQLVKTNQFGESGCNETDIVYSESPLNYTVTSPQYTQFNTPPLIENSTIQQLNYSIETETICQEFCLVPELDSTEYIICDQGCVHFPDPVSIQTEGTIYQWNFSNNESFTTSTASVCLDHFGIDPFKLDLSIEVTTRTGCVSTADYQDIITVSTTPEAYFTYSPDSISLEEPTVHFSNQSANSVYSAWLFGDGATSSETSPLHTYPEVPGNYGVTLTASDFTKNCQSTFETTITLNDEIVFYVPNAFTPGSDNANFIFKPIVRSGVDPYQYHLVIYNRWGEVLFESFDYSKGWDGSYLNDRIVPKGVYMWKIDFKETMSDKHHREIGHVTVLR